MAKQGEGPTGGGPTGPKPGASATLGLGGRDHSGGAAGALGLKGVKRPRKLADFSEDELGLLTPEQLQWLQSGGEI